MRLKEGLKLRPLGKEHIITADSMELVNFNKIISLNESAAYLWKSVSGKDFSTEELSSLLLSRYEVDEETALKDSAAIAKSWIEAGIATE